MARLLRPGLVLAATALLFVAGCELRGEGDEEARALAQRFWSAVLAGDLAGARALSTPSSDRELHELVDHPRIEAVSLGEVLRSESTILIETRAPLRPSGPEIVFHTHLVRREGVWRVDPRSSGRELTREALAANVEAMQESVRESAEVLLEEFERRALEASEALREALEEFERSVRKDPGT